MKLTPGSKEHHMQASVLLEEWISLLGQSSSSTSNSARDRLAQIFVQLLRSEVIHALKALASVEGKAQVNLPALGLNAEDLTALAKEVAVA